MVRGDVKAWLRASGWKYVSKGKSWVKGGLVLVVEPALIDRDRVTWRLSNSVGGYIWSGSGVTETLYETLNRFD